MAARCIRPRSGSVPLDYILEQLASQAREMLALWKTGGVVGDDVELQVVTGSGWDELSTPPTGRKATCRPSSPRRRTESPRCSCAAHRRVLARRLLSARRRKVPNTPTFWELLRLLAGKLVLRGSAVDGDLTARDRRRAVAGQPGDDVRNLFGCHEILQTRLALFIHGAVCER